MSAERQRYDVAVIGGGPGGYPAAIKAAQLGLKTALIEEKELGGTCLNRGCIPSKALIANARKWQHMRRAADYGIEIDGKVSFNYGKMAQQKDRAVGKVRGGLASLIDRNGISRFRGFGKFLSPREIKINGPDSAIIEAERVIIATGSEPRNVAAFPCDHERIYDSTSLLGITELPESLVIIGGGIIGMEFASLYNTFGVKVTVLEMMPSILPMEPTSVSAILAEISKKRGIDIRTSVVVESVTPHDHGVVVRLNDGTTIEAERALISVGRRLNSDKIGLEKIGVLVDEQGIVKVDATMETTVPGIYAVGDIASRWWLAHVATHQGIVAATNAAGGSARMHYNAVPSVIFTDPEVGTVGYSLEEAIKQGYDATIGGFPFHALGKAQATGDTEGFAQVVIDKETRQVLGAQVVGHEAGTLIAEMAIAITNEMTVESITETIHAHPTLAEIWLEAALMANDSPLHLPPEKKRRKVRG